MSSEAWGQKTNINYHGQPATNENVRFVFCCIATRLNCQETMENLPRDYFVTSHQFTSTTYRDLYPAIDPTLPSNSQEGKVIVITGASRGLGARVGPSFIYENIQV